MNPMLAFLNPRRKVFTERMPDLSLEKMCAELETKNNAYKVIDRKLALTEAAKGRITNAYFIEDTPTETLKALVGKTTGALEVAAQQISADAHLSWIKRKMLSASGHIAINPDLIEIFPEKEQPNRIKTATCFLLTNLEKHDIDDISSDLYNRKLLALLPAEERVEHIKNAFSGCAKIAFNDIRNGDGQNALYGSISRSLKNSLTKTHIHDVVTEDFLKENGLLDIQNATGKELDLQCMVLSTYGMHATETFKATYRELTEKALGDIEIAMKESNSDITRGDEKVAAMRKDRDSLKQLSQSLQPKAIAA